jgi:AraC family transcriptional regulator
MAERTKTKRDAPSIRDPMLAAKVVRRRLPVAGMVAELCDFPAVRGEDMTVAERETVLTLVLSPLLGHSQGRYRPGSHSAFATFGPIHLRPAGVPLQYRNDGGPCRSIRCRFDPAHFRRATGLTRDWTPEQLALCLDIRHAAIEDTLLRIADECETPDNNSPTLVAHLSAVLLIDLGRYFQHAQDRAQATQGGLSPRHLRQVRDHVESAEHRPSIDDLAALCGLSRHHFMRAFRQSTGETAAKYVEAARIRRAKKLLTEGAQSISAIGKALGFPSPAAFSMVFKRATGRTPGSYRGRMR